MARHRHTIRSFRVKLRNRANARHRHEQQTAALAAEVLAQRAKADSAFAKPATTSPSVTSCELRLLRHGNPTTDRYVQFTGRYAPPFAVPVAGSVFGFEAQLNEAVGSADRGIVSVSTLEQPITFATQGFDRDNPSTDQIRLGEEVDNLFADVSWDAPGNEQDPSTPFDASVGLDLTPEILGHIPKDSESADTASEDFPEPLFGAPNSDGPSSMGSGINDEVTAGASLEGGSSEALGFNAPVFDDPEAPAQGPVHISIDASDLAALIPRDEATAPESDDLTADKTLTHIPFDVTAASESVTEYRAPSFDEETAVPTKGPFFTWRGKPLGGGPTKASTSSGSSAKKSNGKKQMETDSDNQDANLRYWVDNRLLEGSRLNASDVHITLAQQVIGSTEVEDLRLSARARVDGVMRDMDHIDGIDALAAHRMFKTSADMTTLIRFEPEETIYTIDLDGEARKCRVAGFNTADGGSKIVIRLPLSGPAPKLDELGIADKNKKLLRRLVRSGNKMLIIAGPMGSGKTNTVHAALGDINDGSRVILSLEDPVERVIPGIDQLEVDEKNGAGFGTFLPSLVRSDYDTFFLGEIRDHATAGAGVRQAKAGRQVITTIHANNNITAILRLIELAEDSPLSVLDAVLGIVSQRLVRKLNPTWDGNDPATKYSGRLPIHEILVIGPELVEALMRGATLGDLTAIQAKTSSSTFRMDAARLVTEGVTDQDEVDRVLGVTIEPESL